ncbi:Phox (PX) domain protein [Quillaja saponaria]|uniref:Phox (PX) domain protein n=1 Tax=Quillaja saponaria TaxID=32244 RepID=A0AAD7LY11_QUISA|nr:Phox (PX) domain protein [Quillaja saponaria]
MQRRSPPKHRHDGTSPLPLGMDWSPPPRKWKGRDTIWPHDHRSGWSYCVTIPSWVVLPKSRNSEPVVFYRVQVGLQSAEGITSTTTCGVLRRFNDFLELFTNLKKAFPKKNLPPAPPKGFLRMKTRALLEERRCSLEEWITKLLSDIDISRSVAVASFLELEAAARSSFQDANQQSSEKDPASTSSVSSLQSPPHSSLTLIAGSSSIASDYGSDTAYETSELGTPRLGRDDSSEIGMYNLTLDEDLTNPMERLVKYGISNIDEGLFLGQTILEQLEGLPRHKVHSNHVNDVAGKNTYNGNILKASYLASNPTELFSEAEHAKFTRHVRKLSNESIGSDGSSLRGSDMSNSGIPNLYNGYLDLPGGAEVTSTTDILGNADMQLSGDAQVVIPLDQHHKLNRILLTMQRRLVTAKTDMEDLIVRLNQEIAAKDYLATKVKDLEVELETTKQKSKENLQQAILTERERFTQMQWDMEELLQKSFEMESKLKSDLDGNSCRSSTTESKDALLHELNASTEQFQILSKQYEELELKSKADIKVLVKEVKSLRNSQTKLKQELIQSTKEKCEAEKLLHQEREMGERAKMASRKLLEKCRLLCHQLQECNIDVPAKDNDNANSSSLADALDELTTSDDQIGLLLSEAADLVKDNNKAASGVDEINDFKDVINNDELGKVLADLLIDNASLRKQVNSITRHAVKLKLLSATVDDGSPSTNTTKSLEEI